MTGYTDTSARAALDALVLAYPWLALLTVAPTDAGGGTEVTGGSYARFNTTGSWNAAAGSAPATKTNLTINFGTATAAWGTVVSAGLFSLATGGVLGFWDWLGTTAWQPFFVSLAAPGSLMAKGHGLLVGDSCVVSTEYGGTAPTFANGSFTGLLKVAHATTDVFDVTNSGAQVDTSSTGSGLLRKVTPLVVAAGAPVIFPAGAITLRAA